jgi:hypothetical protein
MGAMPGFTEGAVGFSVYGLAGPWGLAARGFLQSRRGQLSLYIAAIIIFLFFVFTYFQQRALEEFDEQRDNPSLTWNPTLYERMLA